MRRRAIAAICCALLVQGSATALHAENADEFYRGKTLSMIIPIGPGGAYDAYGRLVARFMPRFLPGNPTIVVRNMPGAGGVIASNYVFNVAPQDGSTLTIITSSFATQQILGDPQIKYEASKFLALGRLLDTTSVLFFGHNSSIHTLADLESKPATIANASLTDLGSARIRAMNRYLNSKLKIIPGYPSAQDFVLAVERGETDGGGSTFVGLSQLFREDIRTKRLNILVQFSEQRDQTMPEVPSIVELARSNEAREVFRFVSVNDDVGRSVFTTPNVPADRLATLRRAFEQMTGDPEFRAEALRLDLPLAVKSADELQETVLKTFEISASALATVRELSIP